MKKDGNSVLAFSTGEVLNQPFQKLVAIIGNQLDPGTKVPEAKDLPLTFSAVVSPEETSSKTKEEKQDEDIPLPDLEVVALDEAAIKDKIQTIKKWSEDAGATIIACEEGLAKLAEIEEDPDLLFPQQYC